MKQLPLIQMKLIREESDKLKEIISEYITTLTSTINKRRLELNGMKEKLKRSNTKVQNWLRDKHITEQVQQRQLMAEEMSHAISEIAGIWPCEAPAKPVVTTGDHFMLI